MDFLFMSPLSLGHKSWMKWQKVIFWLNNSLTIRLWFILSYICKQSFLTDSYGMTPQLVSFILLPLSLRKRVPVSLNFDNIGTLANIICLLGSNYRKCCPYLLVLGMNILMLTFMSLNDFYENSSIFKKILTPPSSH